MRGKIAFLLFFVFSSWVAFLFVLGTHAKEEMKSAISAEIEYEDIPDVIKVQNPKIRYKYYTGRSGLVTSGEVHLTSLLYEYKVRNMVITKEIHLSGIKEIMVMK